MIAADIGAAARGGLDDTFGPSTWQVMTSVPWSISALVASASLTASDHSPVKITWVVIDGSTLRAPSVKELMLSSTCGIGFAATKPIFFDLVMWPATMPFRYWPMPI